MMTRFDFGQDTGRFAQQGGLAHAWASQDENGFARFNNVFDDVDRAIDGATDAQS